MEYQRDEHRVHLIVYQKIPSMWTGSYFASTAGNVSQEIIAKYIAAQKGI
jgi:REP element-mobilizing transposase RayT